MELDFKSPIIFYGIILYLLSMIIEGPIRYVLHITGGELLLYFRDLFLFIVIIAYIVKAIMSGRMHKIMLAMFCLIFFHTIIGVFYIQNILQVLFGLKIMMPLFVGMLAYPVFHSRPKTIKYLFLIFFMIAVLGVFINYFKIFPWEGMSYNLAGQEIQESRSWDMLGIKRIAGFSRSSYDVATQIILLSIYLISNLEIKLKLVTLFLWVIAGIAIVLTTTKGMVLAYALLSLFMVMYKIIPNFCNIYQKMLIVPIITTIVLPICAYSLFQSGLLENIKSVLLTSLWSRMLDTWPTALAFLKSRGDLLLGRGIGGIGGSQLYFEQENYTPGDNLFVYALSYFGVMSIAYFAYVYKLAQKIDLKNGLFYYLCLLILFIYGITQSVFESGFFLMFTGMCLRYIWIKTYKNNRVIL